MLGPSLADYEDELNGMEIPDPPPPIMNFDGTGPRLLITTIVNENFKSYYGRHILGPFHKNFTSIVGPNGSGKSNVIDSLLFVFGYRSQKIRSKNISVLIHNSERHPNVNSCTVEVHFVKVIDQGENDYDEIPGSRFEVGRTAYRDNTSVYHINKKRVQFKDVAVLLRENGIDIDHNRFLILQGEVEQISLMKPKAQAEGEEGMLEYLEDIVGSSRLKPFIDQLHKRAEELEELRNEKAHNVKNAEDEKAQLEGPKNEAVAFLEMENEVTRKKNVLFQQYVMEATENCSKVERDLVKTKEDHSKKEAEVKALRVDAQQKQEHLDRLQKKYDDAQNSAEKCAAAFKNLEKEDTKLREDLKHNKGKTVTLESAKEAETKKLNDFKLQPKKCEQQIEELQTKVEQLEAKRKDLEAKIQAGMQKLRDETAASQKEKRALEEKLLGRQKIVADARAKVDLATQELELCLSAQTNEKKKLDELQKSLADVSQSLEDCQKKIEDIEKSLPDLEGKSRKMSQQIKDMTGEEKDLNEQTRDQASRVGTATAALQSYGNRNRVLDALFAQQRKGNLRGVFGRLGDLGAIDEKYDVAISTACGPLDNIVVDTIDTAQACVEILNRNNVGRATFIGLDKMKKFEQVMKQRIQTPEGVPRLFDLVNVEDERVRPAFYFALRDTLVANDLEQATRIAYQGGRAQYRVVTLGGDIIDLSGTMSGGGTRQSRGRMGRAVVATPNKDDLTEDQLKQLQSELESQRARLEQIRISRLRLEADKEKVDSEIQRKTLDLNDSKMRLKPLSERKKILEKQIVDQEKKLAETIPDEADRSKLEKKVKTYQNEYDKIAEASKELESEVKRVDEVIQGIKERLVGSVEKELAATRREIGDSEKAVNKAKVGVKTAHRNIKNSEEKLIAIEQDIEDNKTAIVKIRERLVELEGEGANIVLELNKATEEQKLFESDLQEAKQAVSGHNQNERELQTALVDLKTRLEHVEQLLKKTQQKKHYWEEEVKKLELHNIREMCGLPPEEPRPPPPEQPKLPAKKIKQEAKEDEEEVENGERSDENQPQHQLGDDNEDPNVLQTYSEERLSKIDPKTVAVQLTALEEKVGQMNPNLEVINEYRQKEEKHQRCVKMLEDVTKLRDAFRNRYEELRDKRVNEFLEGFRVISSKLKEMYQMITLGGDADLELVDTMDPFTEGIAFSVRPPKKSWKQIANLSGGEKTLSSLSLVFALHHYKPTPLYVMDEIDAALDFKNVSIVANYIKDRTKNAQFIIISLRNNMFELADRLVGIYKTNHCTKTAAINPREIAMG